MSSPGKTLCPDLKAKAPVDICAISFCKEVVLHLNNTLVCKVQNAYPQQDVQQHWLL